MGLKIFFLDVGQGDGILLEAGKYKVLIDSGPNNNMYGYLTKWQYTYILGAKQKIHIDYLIISHFDVDHYKGVTKILNDSRFTFGTIIHPGILKMATKENPYNSGIGSTIKQDGKTYLSLVFDNLLKISQPVTFNRDITAFLKALLKANDEGRVLKVKRYEQGSKIIQKKIEKKTFRF